MWAAATENARGALTVAVMPVQAVRVNVTAAPQIVPVARGVAAVQAVAAAQEIAPGVKQTAVLIIAQAALDHV